jgi:hypothetical protein
METDFFATMLVPPFHPAADWAESLAENLLHPVLPISYWEALGRRFRRNYFWIFIILGLAWLGKVWLHPYVATSPAEFLARASIGTVPGWLVFGGGVVFNVILILIGLLTVGLQQAAGEVLPRYPVLPLPAALSRGPQARRGVRTWRAWFRPSRQRQQLLAFIITDQTEAVSDKILKEMNRGVTALSGTGMYTGRQHTIFMCALTVTEVAQLKDLVARADPNAFIMISPAQEVLGRGFAPLQTEA